MKCQRVIKAVILAIAIHIQSAQCFSSLATSFASDQFQSPIISTARRSTLTNQSKKIRHVSELNANMSNNVSKTGGHKPTRSTDGNFVAVTGKSLVLGLTILTGSLFFSGSAYADEIGRNVDAPVLFTGEETMICTKRGPLGACKNFEKRTVENDNDQATKYFNDPELKFQEKYKAAQLQAIEDEENGVPKAGSPEFDGNALITKLKQQSEENKEKNESIVRQRTLQNDLGASFGPFSSTVPILNEDGVDYTLLANPQAMRLKKAGYIDDNKKFIKQPSQEVLDEALEASENSAVANIGGAIKSFLPF